MKLDPITEYMLENLHESITDFGSCGNQCIKILGMGTDIKWVTSGSIASTIGGPILGQSKKYGVSSPSISLQTLCKRVCKYQSTKNLRDKEKVKKAQINVLKWIKKFESKDKRKAAIMKQRMSKILTHKFK